MNKDLFEEKLQLIIPLESYRKIMAYAELCNTEISGFADVEYQKELNAFVVGKVYLLEQEGSAASVHMDEEAVAKFNDDLIRKGAKQLPRLWWHSHVNMEAFFSGTDEATTEQLRNDSFNISLVVNKRNQMKAKANIYYESISITKLMGEEETLEEKEWLDIDPMPIHVSMEYQKIPKTLVDEVEKKVSKPKPHVHRTTLPYTSPYILTNQEDKAFGDGAIYIPKKQFANTLPKDRLKAEKKIADLGLRREWDYVLQEWVYKSPHNDDIWVDSWNVLSWNPNDWKEDY
jgi:hypothetical protein